jgi:hypothetical protein
VDKRRKLAREDRLESTIKALGARFGASPLLLAGQSFTVSDLAQMLQDELDAMKGVRAAEAARTGAIAKERALKRRNKPILVALENLVRGLFGGDAAVLGEFALATPKKPRKAPEVKVEAAKKAKATRQVRKTMGRKQKKSVKG